MAPTITLWLLLLQTGGAVEIVGMHRDQAACVRALQASPQSLGFCVQASIAGTLPAPPR